MPAPAIIHAALMRPIVLDSPTGEQAAGFEIVAKNGDQFLVPREPLGQDRPSPCSDLSLWRSLAL